MWAGVIRMLGLLANGALEMIGTFIGSDQEPVRDEGAEQARVEPLGPIYMNFQNSSLVKWANEPGSCLRPTRLISLQARALWLPKYQQYKTEGLRVGWSSSHQHKNSATLARAIYDQLHARHVALLINFQSILVGERGRGRQSACLPLL